MTRQTAAGPARASIAFYAIGRWDAADLQRFVAAVGAMYGLILVCTGELKPGPGIAALFRRGITLLDQELGSFPLTVMDLLRPEEAREAFLRQLQLEYQNHAGDRLYVGSIQIAEPGSAVFAGVEAVIERLREFVKELWSRTQEERERQEQGGRGAAGPWDAQIALRIQQVRFAADYLRGLECYSDLGGQSDERFISEAAAIFAHSVEDLDDLVAAGRILEAPEHLADAE